MPEWNEIGRRHHAKSNPSINYNLQINNKLFIMNIYGKKLKYIDNIVSIKNKMNGNHAIISKHI